MPAPAASEPSRIFGNSDVRLDPWQPDYGPEFAGMESVADGAATQTEVDIEVECPASAWAPVNPGPVAGAAYDAVYFIDGVRRLDARVTAKSLDTNQYHYGAFGAFAVGAVRIDAAEASFHRHITRRLFALTSADLPQNEIRITPELVYLPVSAAGDDNEPDAPLRAIHSEMRRTEESLAKEVAAEQGSLVICDGPLTFEEDTPSDAVGYIKRVMKTYLPPAQLAVLPLLGTGQRTPLFQLQHSGQRFARLSWFLRLTDRRRGDSDFSGIVRMEVAGAVDRTRAIALANLCGAQLPSWKARRALDRRAPQNLMPIGALENFLRHKLGDERIVRRRIETFIAREASH